MHFEKWVHDKSKGILKYDKIKYLELIGTLKLPSTREIDKAGINNFVILVWIILILLSKYLVLRILSNAVPKCNPFNQKSIFSFSISIPQPTISPKL
jgi:hypothetical protein